MTPRKTSARLDRLEKLATPGEAVRPFWQSIRELCAARLLEAFAQLGLEPPANALEPTVAEWQVIAESQQSGLLRLPNRADLPNDAESAR